MHLVVVGGGLAGAGVATAIARSPPRNVPVEVTLIDPKAYLLVPYAALRALVDADVAKKSVLSYDELLGGAGVTHLKSRVTSVAGGCVGLEGGEMVKFDVCFVAVGASWPFGAVQEFSDVDAYLKGVKAVGDGLVGKKVGIIGGGAIGVELAGELAPISGTSVKLVHSKERLCEEVSAKASDMLKRKLETKGVEVVLGERAVESEGGWTLQKGGQALETDIFVQCTGFTPLNGFMQKGELAASLDEAGWIKVDEHFRVEGSGGKVYAMGDCCNKGEKTGKTVDANKSVVVANINATLKALANGINLDTLPSSSLKERKQAMDVTIVSLGPKDGVASTPLGSTSWLLPALKNKDLFVGRGFSLAGKM